MTPIRIAHVTNGFTRNGTGITDMIADLAVEQVQQGHNVLVICGETDDVMPVRLQAHGVKLLDNVDLAVPLRAMRAAGAALNRADVIHVHTAKATVLTAIAAPLNFARRSIATIHNPYTKSARVMLHARSVVVLSSSGRDALIRSGKHRVAFVPNGNLYGAFAHVATEKERVLPDFSVVHAGGLNIRKGVDVLLRAWVAVSNEVPQATLHLLGNRFNPDIEQLAVDLGLGESVTFEGLKDDPTPYMRDATVFVLASRGEGFPLVIPQVRQFGTPIVATNVGGVPDALDGGIAGMLVEPGDVGALSNALIAVLTQRDLRRELSRRSADNLEQFTTYRMAESYTEQYKRLLA